MTGAGILISMAGFVLACFFVLKRLLGFEVAQTGFTTLVTLVLFLGGVQLIAIGLLGEYLARIYDEVKERPLFIVKGSQGVGTDAARNDALKTFQSEQTGTDHSPPSDHRGPSVK